MSDSLEQQQQQQQPQTRLGVVTIHDACPAFSTKIFELADELERLDIKFNIALVPFFNEKQDLPRFPEFVDKIKSYDNCQIVRVNNLFLFSIANCPSHKDSTYSHDKND